MMFCPQSIDWGNAADWVAGIGSMLAVGVAVYIANGQKRFAQHQYLVTRHEQYEHRAHLIAEVIRLTAEIETEARNAKGLLSAGNGILTNNHAGVEEIAALRAQLISLQQLATNDPQIFGEIGRIYRESLKVDGIADRSPTILIMNLGQIIDRMVKRREVMTQLSQVRVSGL